MQKHDVKSKLHRAARALSIGAGALLGAVGFARRSGGGVLLVAAGAAIVHRAITGRWLPGASSTEVADVAAVDRGAVHEAPYPHDLDIVDEAGMESFPASDPPAYSRR